jgi:hypothetical protein
MKISQLEVIVSKIKFKHWDCRLYFGMYRDGTSAIVLYPCDDVEMSGPPVAVATVSMPNVRLEVGEVIIKDYSENEGMLSSLVKAGVVTDTGKVIESGFVVLHICKLNQNWRPHGV